MMSSMTAGSSPNRRPAISASELTIRCAADIRLFSALTACPAPTSPARTTRELMASSIGRTVPNACSEPPTMIVSEPALAPATPPETGASIKVTPEATAQQHMLDHIGVRQAQDDRARVVADRCQAGRRAEAAEAGDGPHDLGRDV